MKRNFVRKTISLVMALTMCFATTVCVSAVETNLPQGGITEESANTRAIGGSGSGYVNCSTTIFKIYSPGWSMWGHAMISCSSNATADIYVIIKNESGQECITGTGTFVKPGQTIKQNLKNTSAGTYTVEIMSSGSGTVTVQLKDLW